MQSIEKANALINSTNNPTEALKKANVDPNFLGKVREWLNTPAYSLFLPMLGVNKKVALEKLDSLEKLIGNNNSIPSPNELTQTSSTQPGQVDDLERFKKGLISFK